MRHQNQKSADLIVGFFILVLVLAAFGRALTAGFILDDYHLIAANPVVTGRSPFSSIFFSQFWAGSGIESSFYRPLVTLSYVLETGFGETAPSAITSSISSPISRRVCCFISWSSSCSTAAPWPRSPPCSLPCIPYTPSP